ncbi:T9SS type A sorting domain-containing protein [candidate division WOR-3 bacterium]|nr:T9SS type A sorting domain-containing protein [candidate division WOR-3 bacterium]
MNKTILVCLLIAAVFALQIHANEKFNQSEEFTPRVSTEADCFPETNPLVKRIIQARENGNMELHAQLLEEYKMQLPVQQNDLPEVINITEEPEPFMRWGNDVTIFSGGVAYNSWAMTGNIDDEAISVDYYKEDTLRAAIAGTDSTCWVYKSDDNGLTWAYDHGFSVGGNALYEPEIIHGPSTGWFHVFARVSGGNGNLIHVRWDEAGTFEYSWIETSDDTVLNYSVCADRSDYQYAYYLYLAYHKGLGGPSADGIFLTRSLNTGVSWETETQLQTNGSGFPDLSWGNASYLHEAYLYEFTDKTRGIRCRRSSNSGVSWFGSITIYSDTTFKMGPQITCSHDGTGDSWVMFPRRDAGTTNLDYGLCWAWCEDFGATWSSVWFVNSWVGDNEVLPSISVHDGYHDSLYYPYVTFIRSVDDWTDPEVCCFNWQSDSTWTSDTTYNDNIPEFTRPIQTWELPGIPAMAYVGSGGTNVYYDSWSNTQVEEEKAPVTKKEIIGSARPNPFTHMTCINYSLPNRGNLTVKAYNILGQEVATIFDGVKESGNHTLEWYGVDNAGKKLPRGVYFLQIKTVNSTSSKKLIIQ